MAADMDVLYNNQVSSTIDLSLSGKISAFLCHSYRFSRYQLSCEKKKRMGAYPNIYKIANLT